MTTPSIMIGPFQIPVNVDGSWIPFGQGSSGIVTRAQDSRSGGIIALKIIPVSLPDDKKAFVVNQLQELYSSKHPSVVDYYGADYFEEKSCIMIALEFMDMASFKDLRNRWGPIPESILGYACGRVLEGLLYLHRERRLIHRDIKPSNLLLSSNGQVKISDFGMSTQLVNTLDPARTWVGSTTYMSPERISGLQYIWNSDIWSLGIALVELATGAFPYAPAMPGGRLELTELLDKIVDEEPPALDPAQFSGDFCGFIGLALKKRMEERPQADVLLTHPFVTRYAAPAIVAAWIQSLPH
mmetsp:Transcript_58303/g.121803  ORF Transcript_58303/g.121803 Transcript_58303/m.121803 type:complete len:298 (-) Transcript_58303:75-968(-)